MLSCSQLAREKIQIIRKKEQKCITRQQAENFKCNYVYTYLIKFFSNFPLKTDIIAVNWTQRFMPIYIFYSDSINVIAFFIRPTFFSQFHRISDCFYLLWRKFNLNFVLFFQHKKNVVSNFVENWMSCQQVFGFGKVRLSG